MTFQSQRVAYPYFVVALLLFLLQVLMGLWVGLQYVITVPQAVVDVFPFATSRAMHTNLLVLWMLLGFSAKDKQGAFPPVSPMYALSPRPPATDSRCR